jgi:hypothetical protein
MEQTVDAALDVVAGIDAALMAAAPTCPACTGSKRRCGPLLGEAAQRGDDARIGCEDWVRPPDGSTPGSNADMVRAARDIQSPEAGPALPRRRRIKATEMPSISRCHSSLYMPVMMMVRARRWSPSTSARMRLLASRYRRSDR